MDFEKLIPRQSLVVVTSSFCLRSRLDTLSRLKKLHLVTVSPDVLADESSLDVKADAIFVSSPVLPDVLANRIKVGGLLVVALACGEREDIVINEDLFEHRASSEVAQQVISVYVPIVH